MEQRIAVGMYILLLLLLVFQIANRNTITFGTSYESWKPIYFSIETTFKSYSINDKNSMEIKKGSEIDHSLNKQHSIFRENGVYVTSSMNEITEKPSTLNNPSEPAFGYPKNIHQNRLEVTEQPTHIVMDLANSNKTGQSNDTSTQSPHIQSMEQSNDIGKESPSTTPPKVVISTQQPYDQTSIVNKFKKAMKDINVLRQTPAPKSVPSQKRSLFRDLLASNYASKQKGVVDRYKKSRSDRIVHLYKQPTVCQTCYLYQNNIVRPYPVQSSTIQYPDENSGMNVTLISVLSPNRIPFIPYLLKRWPGPIVLSLFTIADDLKSTTALLKQYPIPPSMQVLIMVRRHNSNFPINRLRNLAINLVMTSHYLVFDMDMFPSLNLYHELTSLPTSLTSKEKNVFVIPAIFLNRGEILSKCESLMECVAESLKYIPDNKAALYTCYHNDTCFLRKGPRNRNHLYITPEWVDDVNPVISYTKVSCFANRFQEPYVMVKRQRDGIMFNNAFVNYGCNKVQFIEHLRSTNHHFYLLNNAFATDIVHHDSVHRQKYTYAGTAETIMGRYCYSFMDSLAIVYGTNFSTPICISGNSTTTVEE